MNTRATQAERFTQITTPLGADYFVLLRMSGEEAIGIPFTWRIKMFTEEDIPEEDDLIGQDCCVTITAHEGPRYFHGICTELRWTGSSEERSYFEMTLRPELWWLTMSSNSRFFMDKTVEDIAKDLLDEAGISNFRFELSKDPKPIHYCVQYQETNFDFLARLFEKYGLYYFFEHHEDRHDLVVADADTAHQSAPGYDKVPYLPNAEVRHSRDYLTDLRQTGGVAPDEVIANDYNYEKASTKQEKSEFHRTKHGRTGNVLYDFRLNHGVPDEGGALAKVALEAQRAGAKRIQATGTTAGLFSGCMLKIDNDPLPQPGEDLLCVCASHTIISDEYRTTNDGADELVYRGAYEFMHLSIPFRMPKTTPWPRITGPHTAKVVGEDGEEIDVDEDGRILVTFHWQRDDQKSCRVRVAQSLAGKGFGTTQIPRIGHEVLVSFIDGDPDQPIVTGTVYNSDNKPPVKLPENKTQTGIQSESSKGGGGANVINLDDKKDSEMFTVTAEKDFTQTIKNDARITVGYDKGAPGSYYLDVHQDRIETVSNGDYNLGVDTGNRTTFVKTNDIVEVKGNRSETVTGTLGSEAAHITMNGTTDLKVESPDVDINGKTKTKIGSSAIEVDGKTVKVAGAQEISLSVGGSSIVLNAGGVTIVGPLVKIN